MQLPVKYITKSFVSRRRFSVLFLASILFCITNLSNAISQEVFSKEKTIQKYEKALDQAEDLKVYQQDLLHVIPKLQIAISAILREEYQRANRLLDEALSDMEILSLNTNTQYKNTFRLEWLEIYISIVQKYAWIMLLAYFFVRIRFFRRHLVQGKLFFKQRFLIAFLAVFLMLFFVYFDLSKFGESAWSFFDIQIVLMAISGFICGPLLSVGIAILISIFRLMLKPELPLYAVTFLATGFLAGLLSLRLKDFYRGHTLSIWGGLLIGFFHASLIYIPMLKTLSFGYVLLSICFIGILEAGSIFVFFAVVSGVLKEEKRRVMENELLKTKLRFLQAQISPHFLFNALNTISAICNREKAPEASKLILHLANFFRRALKRIEEQITVAEELTYIDSYLELEKARFQERLKIVKKIKVSDESVETPIPFLVIQPLVENAIKHGISKKEEGGTLEIRVYEEAEMLIFEIHDDGIGCPDQKIKEILSSEKREHGAGIGLYNIDQRLRQIYGENFGLKFHTELDQGMTMKVMIPKSSKIE